MQFLQLVVINGDLDGHVVWNTDEINPEETAIMRRKLVDLRQGMERVDFRAPGIAPLSFALGAPPDCPTTSLRSRMISVGPPGDRLGLCNWIFRNGEASDADTRIMKELFEATVPEWEYDPGYIDRFTRKCHGMAPCIVSFVLDKKKSMGEIHIASALAGVMGSLLLFEPMPVGNLFSMGIHAQAA